MLGAMSIATSIPVALQPAVSRRIPRRPSGRTLPAAGDGLTLTAAARLVFDAAFEPAPDGWRARARLIDTGRRPARHERVDIAVIRTSTTACELRVAPHSTHTANWGGRRLRRYFLLAHLAADALVATMEKDLDPPATGAPTLLARTSANEEMTYGFHS